MRNRHHWLTAILLSFILLFGPGYPSLRAASADPDLSIDFTIRDKNGDPVSGFTHGYRVLIQGTTDSGSDLSGDYTLAVSGAADTTVSFSSGSATIEVPAGTVATIRDLPFNSQVKLTVVQRVRSNGNVDAVYEDVTTSDLDSNDSLILDSDKSVHFNVDHESLFKTITIYPKVFEDSWPEDTLFRYKMNFWNEEGLDLSLLSYTIEGDPTVYTPAMVNGRLTIEAMIPVNKKLTIRGLPVSISFGGNNYTTAEQYNIYWNNDYQAVAGGFIAVTDVAAGHESLSSGVIQDKTQGTWTINLFRRSASAAIAKFYAAPAGADPDELYDFKVTLFDTALNRPHTGKVWVTIGSVDLYNSIMHGNFIPSNIPVTEKLVDTDANGSFYLSLKANEVAVLGRLYQDRFYPQDYLTIGTNERVYNNQLSPMLYIPQEGLLPVYTKVTVEELTKDYEAVPGVGKPGGYVQEATSTYATTDVFHYLNARLFDSSLRLSKTVEGENGEFDFTIRLKDVSDTIPDTYSYSGDKQGTLNFAAISSETGTKTAKDGRTSDIEYSIFEATISLKGGESITIDGLPAGCEYEVIEKDPEGYNVESTGSKGTLESGKTSEVSFTNRRITPTPTDTPVSTPTTAATTTSAPPVSSDTTPVPTATETPVPGKVVKTGETSGKAGTYIPVLFLISAVSVGGLFVRKKDEELS